MYAIPEIKVVSVSVREVAEYPQCRTPADVFKMWADTAAAAPQFDPEKEQFVMFALNARNRVKGWQIVTQGIIDAALIHPREVFRPAIVMAAAALIIAHNHPSGDTSPSAEDLAVTRQIIAAGAVIGIPCLDHVIIGHPSDTSAGFLSLRESGMVIFGGK